MPPLTDVPRPRPSAYLIADDLPLQTAAAESDVVRRLEYILEESSGDGSSRENDDEDMDLGEEDLDGKARLREVSHLSLRSCLVLRCVAQLSKSIHLRELYSSSQHSHSTSPTSAPIS